MSADLLSSDLLNGEVSVYSFLLGKRSAKLKRFQQHPLSFIIRVLFKVYYSSQKYSKYPNLINDEKQPLQS